MNLSEISGGFMFVEQLKKEDFLQFTLRNDFVKEEFLRCGNSIDIIRDFEVSDGRVTFSIGRVDFVFTDFDVYNNYMFRSYNGAHDKAWLKFMYDKFGMEYKHEFYKFRTQEKRRFLKSVSDRIDIENAKYELLFNDENEKE